MQKHNLNVFVDGLIPKKSAAKKSIEVKVEFDEPCNGVAEMQFKFTPGGIRVTAIDTEGEVMGSECNVYSDAVDAIRGVS